MAAWAVVVVVVHRHRAGTNREVISNTEYPILNDEVRSISIFGVRHSVFDIPGRLFLFYINPNLL
jgi:hypothetical protein